jgi:hypothetical protein
MEGKRQPRFHPISALPLIAGMIGGMLKDAEEQYRLLLQAREKPHALDDQTVGRVVAVYTEQTTYLGVFEEQLARWRKTDLTAMQSREVEHVGSKLKRLRDLVASILTLTEELKRGTIERILEMSDIEIALAVLSGKLKVPR